MSASGKRKADALSSSPLISADPPPSAFPETAQCTICLEQVVLRGLARECRSHYYCYKCIHEWVTRHTPRCPICKAIITKIKRCKSPAEEQNVDWDKVAELPLNEKVRNSLTEEELQELEDMLDTSYHSPSEDDETESVGEIEREYAEEERRLGNHNEEEEEDDDGRLTPCSYWDDRLSRGPVFHDEDESWGGGGGGGEEIAFSTVPGEEDRFPMRALRDHDGDYKPPRNYDEGKARDRSPIATRRGRRELIGSPVRAPRPPATKSAARKKK